MKEFYRIHELSGLFGLCPDTLRYYEEKGLLHPARVEKTAIACTEFRT